MSLSNPRRRSPAADAAQSSESGPALKTSMTLRKGATFHSPTTSTPAASQTFLPPRLPRSQSHMDDVVDANRRRIALTLTEIDEALSLDKLSLSSKEEKKDCLRDTSLPVPRGFLDLPIVDPAMERRVLRPRSVRRTNHASDSGIGSSLASASTKEKGEGADSSKTRKFKRQGSAAAITRSVVSANMEGLPSLGPKAVNRIHEHTLGPLLEKSVLKDFEPIVLDIPRRIRSKEIICLRDLEKTLLFMAPEKAKTGILYLDFCLTSIRCIQATVEYLTDREQVRPGDRPYTNGYFIDLKDQILQYGRDLAASKGDDSMDIDRSEEIQLYGGLSENGRPAELVRIKKDGTIISMATGKPIDISNTDSPIQFKRSLSEQREDDEEIMRSMARRKKNATPEELAPKKCSHAGCSKEFKRPCDLTKHEKTHSRPWKCPIPTCKYHEFGWPTEKEMDRHVNDKHSDKPAMFECHFKPCPYKSKRESNCKQHMEKAHGWTYVRTKIGGKKSSGNPTISDPHTPPLASTSSPSDAYSVPTPPQDGYVHQPRATDFPQYPSEADWLANYGLGPDNLESMELTLEHLSPSSAASYEQCPPYQNGSQFVTDEDIYAATAHIPHQLSIPNESLMYNKMIPQQHLPLHQQHPQRPQQHPNLHHHQHAGAQMQQSFGPAQPFHAAQGAVPPHFSPNAQQNTMLYTPPDQVDDGYEETFTGVDGADFQLFPANMNKGSAVQPLFGEVPSADLGFSQTSQPEIFQQIDLSQLDYHGFHE